ncbi:MAG: right-handed parallel beta-helix repeat-containing protein [Planctomycetota bacterium]
MAGARQGEDGPHRVPRGLRNPLMGGLIQLTLMGVVCAVAAASPAHEQPPPGTTWFVDAGGAGLGTGTANDPFTNISYGVSRSFVTSGDTFEVAPGTYENEEINFFGKSLVIRSTGGASVTTIVALPTTNPMEPHVAARLTSGEIGAVIDGFHITGGTGSLECTGFTRVVGGAIEACAGTSLTVRNCSFQGNTAERGGAIYAQEAELHVENCDFRGPGTEARGEAIYLLNAMATVEHSTFEGFYLVNPRTPRGGTAVVADQSTLVMERCTFDENATRFFGAHVWSRLGDVTLLRCVLGRATGFAGTGVSASGGTLRLIGTTVQFTRAIQAPGAGVFASNADVLVDGCTFEANIIDGSREGGAIAVQSGRLTVAESTFIRNRAGQGGAIATSQSANTLITESRFEGNTATNGGGAFFSGDSLATIERCDFVGNTALPSGPGGAVLGRALLDHCSLSGNASGDPGGAASGMAHLFRSIAWGNTPSDLDASCSAAESLVGQEGGAATTRPVMGNPLFWTQADDLHLLPGSPAIDAVHPKAGLDPDGSPMELGAFPFDPRYCPASCSPSLGNVECAGTPNSTGVPASFTAFGSPALALNRLLVVAEGLPTDISTLVLASRSEAAIAVPGMLGQLCVGPPFFRLVSDARLSRPDGTAPTWVRLAGPGGRPEEGLPAVAGDTWYFQLWYRDAYQGAVTNTSNSVRVSLR